MRPWCRPAAGTCTCRSRRWRSRRSSRPMPRTTPTWPRPCAACAPWPAFAGASGSTRTAPWPPRCATCRPSPTKTTRRRTARCTHWSAGRGAAGATNWRSPGRSSSRSRRPTQALRWNTPPGTGWKAAAAPPWPRPWAWPHRRHRPGPNAGRARGCRCTWPSSPPPRWRCWPRPCHRCATGRRAMAAWVSWRCCCWCCGRPRKSRCRPGTACCANGCRRAACRVWLSTTACRRRTVCWWWCPACWAATPPPTPWPHRSNATTWPATRPGRSTRSCRTTPMPPPKPATPTRRSWPMPTRRSPR